jgi:hypothetical protein
MFPRTPTELQSARLTATPSESWQAIVVAWPEEVFSHDDGQQHVLPSSQEVSRLGDEGLVTSRASPSEIDQQVMEHQRW